MSLWVGVMSGTSLDGIDIGIVDFSGDREHPDAWDLVAFRTRPYETDLRARIRAAIAEGTARSLCDLDFELGRRIGEAVEASLEESGLAKREVAGIGSHGQTVWHRPPAAGEPGATLQLGRASVIAELTGLPVVSDFRTRDMAAGGEGAPLTAYTDDVLFRGSEALAIQNIGGMANVTALPARDAPDQPLAFDSGPGVALLDAA
ncbi:MAG: anhydro-N-acetylmuramic acid kinase, partial [Gemmatimonadota bacterium]|nr:anhydro-N-acetylmuramic acid kinase [Gemmatimonadota bacterium]